MTCLHGKRLDAQQTGPARGGGEKGGAGNGCFKPSQQLRLNRCTATDSGLGRKVEQVPGTLDSTNALRLRCGLVTVTFK